MNHPPYSPNLAPNDFFLFLYVKQIRGQHFSTPKEAVDAYRMHVLGIPQSELQRGFDNSFKRRQSVQILMGNILKNNKAIFDY